MTKSVFKVLVFGGRDFTDQAQVDRCLDQVWRMCSGDESPRRICVIEGGARGADRCGKVWARSHGLPVLTVDADWDSYKKAAGHIRNQWMIDYAQPDYAVGFPGGAGTADMCSRLTQAKVPLWLPV